MYHPMLLQPDALRDLPDDRSPCEPAPAVFSYRSEAFAEDLYGEPAAAATAAADDALRVTLLSLAPLLVVLASAGLAVLA